MAQQVGGQGVLASGPTGSPGGGRLENRRGGRGNDAQKIRERPGGQQVEQDGLRIGRLDLADGRGGVGLQIRAPLAALLLGGLMVRVLIATAGQPPTLRQGAVKARRETGEGEDQDEQALGHRA